ncbi:hypothetical protein L596_030167 [Steinernema carpocapsae]|uniref:Uncharacterized protein n=1 Tax=Steinernema carpocapsae TaxID=34508 RepID=A0A4U5LRX4_STECR|nr:hypothetical protein L596_030167 [Steinernema carpocapsae]
MNASNVFLSSSTALIFSWTAALFSVIVVSRTNGSDVDDLVSGCVLSRDVDTNLRSAFTFRVNTACRPLLLWSFSDLNPAYFWQSVRRMLQLPRKFACCFVRNESLVAEYAVVVVVAFLLGTMHHKNDASLGLLAKRRIPDMTATR